MTTLRVGINGFGRIGRLVMRAGLTHPNIEFVGVNDLATAEDLAYLFKYDSTHGTFAGEVESETDRLIINGMSVDCRSSRDHAELPWQALKVDYVVEATGLFRHYDDALKHIHAGAKRVILTAPGKDSDKIPTLVLGVNHEKFNPATDTMEILHKNCLFSAM